MSAHLLLLLALGAAGTYAQPAALLRPAPGAWIELSDGTRRDVAQLLATHWAARDAGAAAASGAGGAAAAPEAGAFCCVPVWNGRASSGEVWASVTRAAPGVVLTTDPTCAAQPVCSFPLAGAPAFVSLCRGGARCVPTAAGPTAGGGDGGSGGGGNATLGGNGTAAAAGAGAGGGAGAAASSANPGAAPRTGPAASQSPPIEAEDGAAGPRRNATAAPVVLAALAARAAGGAPSAPAANNATGRIVQSLSNAVSAARERAEAALQGLGTRLDVLVLPPQTSGGAPAAAGGRAALALALVAALCLLVLA
jgi:hypothetical protein